MDIVVPRTAGLALTTGTCGSVKTARSCVTDAVVPIQVRGRKLPISDPDNVYNYSKLSVGFLGSLGVVQCNMRWRHQTTLEGSSSASIEWWKAMPRVISGSGQLQSKPMLWYANKSFLPFGYSQF